ncbi:hypothetical protein [Roseivivax lentus]|uniref:hypothetical protein n=1 Tax=Roseivivax lentus TaxID=633194 RepID=UPI000970643B|nr:hypothetical protein [Roseivivax lentus]
MFWVAGVEEIVARSDKEIVEIPVKGGSIRRDAKTGKFVSVVSKGRVTRTSKVSHQTLEDVVERRRSALERLADR